MKVSKQFIQRQNQQMDQGTIQPWGLYVLFLMELWASAEIEPGWIEQQSFNLTTEPRLILRNS